MEDGPISIPGVGRAMLVKVPQDVAEAWLAQIQAAMDPESLEDDTELQPLATVIVDRSGPGGMTLLTESKQGPSQGSQTGPQRSFKLAPLPPPPPPLNAKLGDPRPGSFAMSFKADSSGEKTYTMFNLPQKTTQKDQGTSSNVAYIDILESYNAVPMGAGEDVDPGYFAAHKERARLACVKARTAQEYMSNTREGALREIKHARDSARELKEKTEAAKRARVEAQRLPRLDEGQLERVLFDLFEQQPRWTLTQLVDATKQATSHVRTGVEKIAELHKKGLHKGTYELKTEYRVGQPETGEGEQTEEQADTDP